MIRWGLRTLTLGTRLVSQKGIAMSRPTPTMLTRYSFCKDHKHSHGHEHPHEHEAGQKDSQKEQKDSHKHQETGRHSAKDHENHGKKEHGHHHEHHKEPKHHKDSHDHQHTKNHHHHQSHHTKLSKMTFQELMELKTQESIRYANLIYDQERKKMKELDEEKEHLLKNIEFYRKLQDEITEKEQKLQANIKEYEEQAQLSKKRADREVEESKQFAVTKIAKQLLEVADCIKNCKKYAQQSETKDKYIELLIESEDVVKKILQKYDIQEFDPTNKQFDPNLAESMVNVPTPPGFTAGNVAMTMRTGYTIRGRLLRSARVGVFV